MWYVMEGITLSMVLLYHAEEVGGVALNGLSGRVAGLQRSKHRATE